MNNEYQIQIEQEFLKKLILDAAQNLLACRKMGTGIHLSAAEEWETRIEWLKGYLKNV